MTYMSVNVRQLSFVMVCTYVYRIDFILCLNMSVCEGLTERCHEVCHCLQDQLYFVMDYDDVSRTDCTLHEVCRCL